MAKTLIGNVKGKDGRGIASIEKTGTTGSVDTYTIRYTDDTTSTYTVNNSDGISLQRQIVPSAAVESSSTASQAYAAGDYVVVNGVLRKVKSAIAKGNTISDSNSTATTVTGELVSLASKSGETDTWHSLYDLGVSHVYYTKRNGVLYIEACANGLNQSGWKAGTLPAEYRPKKDFHAPMYVRDENSCAGIHINTSGEVILTSYQAHETTQSMVTIAIPLW